VAAGVAVVISAVACGNGGSSRPANLARGRMLFLAGQHGQLSCGFCHTLRAAAATGPFGPDLDNIFTQHTLSRNAFGEFVLKQIGNPLCLDPNDPSRCMPKDIVRGGDAKDVAAYVANCAGRPGTSGCKPFPGGLRGEAGRGEHLYAQLGCVSCHWTNGNVVIAPTLNGLYGSDIELADGTTVTADRTYLLESILLPDKQIAKGFPAGYMSARVRPGQVTSAQANALVAYIESLK
jgi:cytochrome c2